jgi:tetratricopeptide (TPR) repeat protein
MNQLAGYYAKYNTGKFFRVVSAADSLSDKLKYKRGKGMALYNYGFKAYIERDYLNSIQYFHEAIDIFEAINDELNLAQTFQRISVALFYSETNRAGVSEYMLNATKLFHNAGYPKGEAISCFLIGGGLLRLNRFEEGIEYMHQYFRIADSIGDLPVFRGTAYAVIGDCYYQQKKYQPAILYCDSSLYYANLLDSTGYYYENDTLKNYIGHTEEIFYPVSKARRRFYAWEYKVSAYEILTEIYRQTGQYKKSSGINRTLVEH